MIVWKSVWFVNVDGLTAIQEGNRILEFKESVEKGMSGSPNIIRESYYLPVRGQPTSCVDFSVKLD